MRDIVIFHHVLYQETNNHSRLHRAQRETDADHDTTETVQSCQGDILYSSSFPELKCSALLEWRLEKTSHSRFRVDLRQRRWAKRGLITKWHFKVD